MSDTDFCGLLGWGGRALVACDGEVPGSGEGVVGPEEVGTVEVRRRLGLAGGRPFDCEPGSGAPLCNPLLPAPVCRSISWGSLSRAHQVQRDCDMNASQVAVPHMQPAPCSASLHKPFKLNMHRHDIAGQGVMSHYGIRHSQSSSAKARQLQYQTA